MLVKQLLVKHSLMCALHDFRHDFIKFPSNEAEKFEELSNLLNIAGAIDGTHIKIKAPKESAVDYFSWYQQQDVAAQGIVDGRKIFIDIATGFSEGTGIRYRSANSCIWRSRNKALFGGGIVLTRFRAGFRNLSLREQEIQVRFNLTSSCLPQELRWGAHLE